MPTRTFQAEWWNLQERLSAVRQSNQALRVSQVLSELLIAGEDHRYQFHPGVDPIALCRAVWRSSFCGRREGGSTIAMQLVRVLTGNYEKTLNRKMLEIYLAINVTKLVPLREIPQLYLSVAYYGWRMNGLLQACERLVLDPETISPHEAATIVARLKYPEPRFCNEVRSRQIQARAVHILRRHQKLNYQPISDIAKRVDANGSV